MPMRCVAVVGTPFLLTLHRLSGSWRSNDIAKRPRTEAIQMITDVFRNQHMKPIPSAIDSQAMPPSMAA